jgi:CHAT domain-containing protein
VLLQRVRRSGFRSVRRTRSGTWCDAMASLLEVRQDEELSANPEALYAALWAPIEQALPTEIKRIIISPARQLNFISVATLLDKGRQFLAQRYTVQYVASGRDLLQKVSSSTSREEQDRSLPRALVAFERVGKGEHCVVRAQQWV